MNVYVRRGAIIWNTVDNSKMVFKDTASAIKHMKDLELSSVIIRSKKKKK